METCRVCGGDGRIGNAFGGSSTTCPGCRGTGRRSDSEGIRDVTKTKPSHHRPAVRTAAPEKPTWPSTSEGTQLANEVKASGGLSEQVKLQLIRDIIEYEGSHGRCTKTFSRKIRRQITPPAG